MAFTLCVPLLAQDTYPLVQNPHAKLHIILAGASTVQAGSGWGPGFIASLKPTVECLNLSKGERSTRTYRAMAHTSTRMVA